MRIFGQGLVQPTICCLVSSNPTLSEATCPKTRRPGQGGDGVLVAGPERRSRRAVPGAAAAADSDAPPQCGGGSPICPCGGGRPALRTSGTTQPALNEEQSFWAPSHDAGARPRATPLPGEGYAAEAARGGVVMCGGGEGRGAMRGAFGLNTRKSEVESLYRYLVHPLRTPSS